MTRIATPPDGAPMVVIYDGDCPFCSNFVTLMVLKRAVGGVTLIDAREGGPMVDEVLAKGYDLNIGMVVLFGGEVYFGSDAVALISALSQEKGGAGAKLISFMLRDPGRAKVMYPFMRFGRRIVLTLLGRPLIDTHPAAPSV
jgi:predicted DCC family thiol-disulfide oxidoreductase YuxK